jgi:hypothetical protein
VVPHQLRELLHQGRQYHPYPAWDQSRWLQAQRHHHANVVTVIVIMPVPATIVSLLYITLP